MAEETLAAYTEPSPLAAVHVARTFPFPRERVFRAWTEAEAVQQWFGTRGSIIESIETDVRVGGRYRVTVKVPPTMRRAHVGGTYLEVTPPERLVFTWAWEKMPITGGMGDSKVTVEFEEVGDGTEVRLTHELLDKGRLRAFHRFGWRGSMRRLAAYLGCQDSSL
jgi:uncharacterized protein YndB with AHSA1/START domain